MFDGKSIGTTSAEIERFKREYPSVLNHVVKSDMTLSRLGINMGMASSKTMERRDISVRGSVNQITAEQNVVFDKVIDAEDTMTIDILYTRHIEYTPTEASIWGGRNFYEGVAKRSNQVANEISQFLAQTIMRECIEGGAPKDKDGGYTLAASGTSLTQNVEDLLLEFGENARQNAGMADDAPLDLYCAPSVKTRIIKGLTGYQNAFSAAIQGGGFNRNVYGGMFKSTWDTPIDFDIRLIRQPTNGQTLKLSINHQTFVITFTTGTITDASYNTVKVQSSIEETVKALGELLQDPSHYDSNGERTVTTQNVNYARYSRTSWKSADGVKGDNYHNLRDAVMKFSVNRDSSNDVDVTDGASTSKVIKVKAYGLGKVDTTGISNTIAIENVKYTILCVSRPVVEFYHSYKERIADVISQVNPNNLLWRKFAYAAYMGCKLWPDKKFYVRQTEVTLA